ncbi:MAG: hypothetical protein RLZZ76_153 [Candidatus Parcubacteria bacterium]|jgi:uncharacterized membrane protein YcgQ (UPF0703/DUF1980 family)
MNTSTKRKVTLMLDSQVYDAIVAKFGTRGLGAYISDLVRPRLVSADLDEGYKAMATDKAHEAEAKEWTEGTLLKVDDENVWTF